MSEDRGILCAVGIASFAFPFAITWPFNTQYCKYHLYDETCAEAVMQQNFVVSFVAFSAILASIAFCCRVSYINSLSRGMVQEEEARNPLIKAAREPSLQGIKSGF